MARSSSSNVATAVGGNEQGCTGICMKLMPSLKSLNSYAYLTATVMEFKDMHMPCVGSDNKQLHVEQAC